MDRFEVENFTTVTDLVDQDCTFSLPVKSEFDLVDLNRCFIQGGSTSFTDKYRLSNSQACVTFMEKLFPVPSCVYEEDENGEESDTPKVLRTEAQASTMWGIPDPSTLGSVQSSSEWEPASDYEGSKSYEYWDVNNGLNNNISYTNILDECDISFYGLPKGEAYICSWVNGGSVLCNNLNFFAINLDAPPPVDEDSAFLDTYEAPMERRPYGCYLVIDGQDVNKFPERQDTIPIEQTVKNQTVRFINFGLSAEEQWYHAYFVQPLAYRLTFQDLEVYKMELMDSDALVFDGLNKLPPPPVKRPELQEPVFDLDSMDGECVYSYSSITAYELPMGGAGYLVFPSIQSTQSNIITPGSIYVNDVIELYDFSVVTCGELKGGDTTIDENSVVNVGGFGGHIMGDITIDDSSALNIENIPGDSDKLFMAEFIRCVNNSKIKANDLLVSDGLEANTDASVDIGTFYGPAELQGCKATFGTFVGNCDIRDMDGWTIEDLYEEADGTFLRANGKITRVYAYDTIVVSDCSIEVDEWYGELPGVSNNASVISGLYSPNLPPFPEP